MPVQAFDAPAYFSDVAAEFDGSYAHDANRLERLAVWQDFLSRHIAGARDAYDLGCGSGRLACAMGRRGIRTIGVDAAPGMLAIARRQAAQDGLDCVSFRQARLPVTDTTGWDPADAVIASSALEYLPSLPDALRSAHALLRPGGVLILSMSNRDAISRRLVRAVHAVTGRPRYLGLLHQFCTPDRLRSDLCRAGFRPLDHRYFAGKDRLNRLLGLALPPRLSCNMIIMAAHRH